jgi:RNA recognition motif-containing protein
MSDEVTKTEPPAVAEKPEDPEEEEDLEKLQAEIERMEAEAARITKETEALEGGGKSSGGGEAKKEESKADVAKRDGLSVYVGQVDYMATPEDLLGHFEACGTVERVTIVCDKMSGRPKGK